MSANFEKLEAEQTELKEPEVTITAKDTHLLSDKFELLEEIGKGAWSTVYRAQHHRLDKIVAVKVLHPHLIDSADRLQRFQLEAETIAKLNHSGIVRVYDFGCARGESPFIVSDLVEGESLAAVLARGETLNIDRCALMAQQVADALSSAHELEVIHRDVKPANILLEDTSGNARLVDFGIVKTIANDGKPELTQTGDIVGTPQYMSPEQCYARQLDGRADVYSLGCIMWECLKGKKLFEGKSTFDCMRKHLESTPEPLFTDKNSEQQILFNDTVMACLQKDAKDRPTASALSEILKSYCNGDYAKARQLLSKKLPESRKITAGSKQSGGNDRLWQLCALTVVVIAVFFLNQVLTAKQNAQITQNNNSAPGSTNPQPLTTQNDPIPAVQSANFKIKAAQPDIALTDSYTHMLRTAMMDVQLGINQRKQDNHQTEANALTQEFNVFRDQYATGQGTFAAKSPVHVVCIGTGKKLNDLSKFGTASVVVTYEDKPIELLLNSLSSTEWTIKLAPGAKIERVYLVQPPGEAQRVKGLPPGTPVERVSYQGSGQTMSPDPASSASGELNYITQKYAHHGGATYQGSYSPGDLPWVIGPESDSWRAQMILRAMGTLHEKAMAPVRTNILNWLSKQNLSVPAREGVSDLTNSSIDVPAKAFDYLPGVIADSWNPPADTVFHLNNKDGWAVPDNTLPKVVSTASREKYAACWSGVIKLNRYHNGGEGVFPPPANSTFNINDFDIAIDPIKDKLLMKSYDTVFSVDPLTGKWSGLSQLEDGGGAIESGFSSDGKFMYTLRETASLVCRWMNGKIATKNRLSYKIPGFLENHRPYHIMIEIDPYLIVIGSVPLESGNWNSPAATMGLAVPNANDSNRVDLRKYLWVIDKLSGRVLLTAPVDKRSN